MADQIWARIQDGVVFELTSTDPEGRFPSELTWVEATPDVAQGFKYNKKTKKFTPVEPPAEQEVVRDPGGPETPGEFTEPPIGPIEE